MSLRAQLPGLRKRDTLRFRQGYDGLGNGREGRKYARQNSDCDTRDEG